MVPAALSRNQREFTVIGKKSRYLVLLVLGIGVVTMAATGHCQYTTNKSDWPQWRGPYRKNVSGGTGLLKEWPEPGPPLVWQAEGLGRGIASVAVAAGRVYTVGYHFPGTKVIRTLSGRTRGFTRAEIPQGEYVIALDASSGQLLWATRTGKAVFENHLMRWLSQRTPTVDGDRLWARRSRET